MNCCIGMQGCKEFVTAAVRQCSTANWVARCTAQEMSRKSLARYLCVEVFC